MEAIIQLIMVEAVQQMISLLQDRFKEYLPIIIQEMGVVKIEAVKQRQMVWDTRFIAKQAKLIKQH